jgi:hypothetical protein
MAIVRCRLGNQQRPERLVTVEGGMDDPDGLESAPEHLRAGDEGWDLSAPLARSDPEDEDLT